MPCSITVVGARPQSHITALNPVTCTMGMSSRFASGCTLPVAESGGALCSTYTAGTSIPARSPGPTLQQVDLVRPLQYDDVDVGVPQLIRTEFAGGIRPLPCPGASATVRSRDPVAPATGSRRGRRRRRSSMTRGRARSGFFMLAPPPRRSRPDPATAVTTSSGGIDAETRVSRDRAVPGPAVPAGLLLVTQHDRSAPRRAPIAPTGTTGENKRHDRRSHRGREVRRPGVADDDTGCAGDDAGESGQVGPARQIDRHAVPAATAASSRSAGPPVTTTGQPATDECGHDRRGVLRCEGP